MLPEPLARVISSSARLRLTILLPIKTTSAHSRSWSVVNSRFSSTNLSSHVSGSIAATVRSPKGGVM